MYVCTRSHRDYDWWFIPSQPITNIQYICKYHSSTQVGRHWTPSPLKITRPGRRRLVRRMLNMLRLLRDVKDESKCVTEDSLFEYGMCANNVFLAGHWGNTSVCKTLQVRIQLQNEPISEKMVIKFRISERLHCHKASDVFLMLWLETGNNAGSRASSKSSTHFSRPFES